MSNLNIVDMTSQRWVGALAILAGVLALLSLVVGVIGVNYDFDVFSDASSLIAAGKEAAQYIGWSYWMNMFGNYLLLIPLALFIKRWSEENTSFFSDIGTWSGILYLSLGAAGSAILASTWPFLIEQYTDTTLDSERQVLVISFQTVNAIAEKGLHGALQNLCGVIWFFYIGLRLKAKLKLFSVTATLISLCLLVNTLGNLFALEALTMVGLMGNIVIGPIWFICFGGYLLSAKE